jgi:hypothetical protein
MWCPSRTRSAEGDGLCGFSFELVAVSMLEMSSPRDRGLLPPHGEQSVERASGSAVSTRLKFGAHHRGQIRTSCGEDGP